MAQNNFFENEKYEQNVKNNKHQDVINYVGNPKRNEKGKYTELNFKKEDLEQALYSLKKDVPKIAEAFPNGFNNETLFVMKHQLDAYYNGLSDMTPQEVFSAKNILSLQNKPTVKALSEFAETKKLKAPLETLKITDENGQKISEKRIGENIKDTDPDNLINLHKLRLVPLNEKGQHLKMKNEKNLISDTSAAAFQSEQKKVSKDIENALKEFGIKTPTKEKTPNRKPEDGISKGNTVNQKEDRTFHEKFVALRNEAYAKLKMRVASLSNTSNYTNAESSKDSSTLSNNGDENLLNQVAEKINTVENKINAAENGTNNSEGVQSNVQETGQTQSDTSATVTENSGNANSSSSNSKKNSNSKNKDKGSKDKDNKDSKDKGSKGKDNKDSKDKGSKGKDNKDKKNSSSETKQNNKSSEENSIQKDNAEKGNNKETQNSKAQDVKPMPVSENQGPQPQSQLQTQQQPQLSKGMEYVANEEKYQKKLDASRKEKERLEGRIKGVQARMGETMMEKSTPENEKKLENLRKEVNGLRKAHNKEVWNVSTYGATRDKFSREKHTYLTADESRALRQKEQQELDKIRVEKNQLITKMQNSSDKEEKKLNEKLKEVKKAENIKRERRNEYSR